MPQLVNVPGQGILSFPDGMSDDEMALAINRNFFPENLPGAKPLPLADTTSTQPVFDTSGMPGPATQSYDKVDLEGNPAADSPYNFTPATPPGSQPIAPGSVPADIASAVPVAGAAQPPPYARTLSTPAQQQPAIDAQRAVTAGLPQEPQSPGFGSSAAELIQYQQDLKNYQDQAAQSGVQQITNPGIDRPLGAALDYTIKAVRATGQDSVNAAVGLVKAADMYPENLMALSEGHPLPVDIQAHEMDGLAGLVTRFGQAIPDVVYRTMLGRGLTAAGLPPGLSQGAAFGLTPEGISPKMAAVMAMMGPVGDFGAKMAAWGINFPVKGIATIAPRMVDETGRQIGAEVLQAFEGQPFIKNQITAKAVEEIIGRGGATTAFYTVSQLPEIMALPPAERWKAMRDSVAFGMAFSLASIPGVIDAGTPSQSVMALMKRIRVLYPGASHYANTGEPVEPQPQEPNANPEPSPVETVRGETPGPASQVATGIPGEVQQPAAPQETQNNAPSPAQGQVNRDYSQTNGETPGFPVKAAAPEALRVPEVPAQETPAKLSVAAKILKARGVEDNVAASVISATGPKRPDETAEDYRTRLQAVHDAAGFKVKDNISEDQRRTSLAAQGESPEAIDQAVQSSRERQAAIDAANNEILRTNPPKPAMPPPPVAPQPAVRPARRTVAPESSPLETMRPPSEELIQQAIHAVRTVPTVGTAWLQRQLRLPYETAKSVMAELEKRGVVGPAVALQPRVVLPVAASAVAATPPPVQAEAGSTPGAGSKFPNTGPGSPADEYGAFYGPKLSQIQVSKFSEQLGESHSLPSKAGANVTLKVKPGMLWVEASRVLKSSNRAKEEEVGVAYLKIRTDGTTVIDSSHHGREIDKIAGAALMDFLRSDSSTGHPPDKTARNETLSTPEISSKSAGLPETAAAKTPALGTVHEIATADATGQEKAQAIKKLAAASGATTKAVQESIESEIVKISDTVVRDPSTAPGQKFDSLVQLYEKQPVMSARTSTSIENQAYSTPPPLAYAVGYAIDAHGKSAYDPTAGNGILLIGSNLKSSSANELNPERAASVSKFLGGNTTQHDAMSYVPARQHQSVLTNPPFGTIPNVNYNGYGITKLEHLIALKALESMKPDGRAVMILGAKREPGEGGRGAQWIFENYVYGHYHVADNFEVEGDLYGRQGAKWPIRIIVVNGKRTAPIMGDLAAKSVDRLKTWDEVWERAQKVRNEIESGRSDLATPGPAAIPTGVPGQVPAEPRTVPPQTSGPTISARRKRQSGGSPVSQQPVAGQPAVGSTGAVTTENAARSEDTISTPAQPSGGGVATPRVEVGVRRGKSAEASHGSGSPAGSGTVKHGSVPKPPPLVAGAEFQVPYEPRSDGVPFGTLSPKGIASGVSTALDELVSRVGPLDAYLSDRLMMPLEQLHKGMAAEQIDGAALAIDKVEHGGAMIIGDETGIGKGRQAAAMIRYSILTGRIPVFFTKDPKLFSDMWGDLRDIGTDIKPFILGDPSKATIVDENGVKIHRAPGKAVQDREMQRILEKGLTEAGYNAVFVTYSQVNQRNRRQEFLEKLAENPTVVVMDEAHESAGDAGTSMQAAFFSGGTVKRGSGPDRTVVSVKGLLNASGTKTDGNGGVLYLSATFAKRPENMAVYYRTSLHKAADSFTKIVDAMKRGGVALQQAVSEALAQAGEYVRRERDFTGVTYQMKHLDVKDPAELIEQVDSITDILQQVVDFSARISEKASSKNQKSTAMSGTKVDMTEFAAVVHNQVGQLLLAAKADATVAEALAAHQQGKKPVIGLMNTMESFLDHYTDDYDVKAGDPVKIGWSELLKYALSRSLRAAVKHPNGENEIIILDPADYGLSADFNSVMAQAEAVETKFPVSPIDYIVQKLTTAGVRMGELTGRESGIKYTNFDTGEGTYFKFKKANKNTLVNGFNGGDLDGLLLNASGSTGLSIHASPKFKERPIKPRHMFIAQPALDIAVFIQLLGRIKRTGMIPGGAQYSHLVLPLQAELRPAAMAARKMKSLNANTTAAADSAVKIEAEDLMNKYGDAVVTEFLEAHPELQFALDLTLDTDKEGAAKVGDDVARKFTGRMALRPDAEQKRAYEQIIPAYREMVDQAKRTGEYDLEVVTHDDWDGNRISDEQLSPGTDESNIFTASTRVQQWSVKDTRHVPTGAEMVAAFRKHVGTAQALESQWQSLGSEVEVLFEKRLAEAKHLSDTAAPGLPKASADTKLAAVGGLQDRWKSLAGNLKGIIRTAGDVLEIEDSETGNTYQGMLVSAALPSADNIRMPPSLFKFKFMVNDPAGQLVLNGASLNSGRFSISPAYINPDQIEPTLSGSRRDRYFIIGNPIRGYDATGGKGKMVRFKDSEGTVVTGLLMPTKWEPANLVNDPRFDLASAAAAESYLKETGEPVRAGNLVQVAKPRGYGRGWSIVVPSAKSTGGPVYLDDKLRDMVGDFTKTGNRMVAQLPEADLREGLNRISEIVKARFRPLRADDYTKNQVQKANSGSRSLSQSPGGVEAYYNYETGTATIDPSIPDNRRAELAWHEIAVHGGIESVARQNTPDGAMMRRAIEAASHYLLGEADALARAGGFTDAQALIDRYDFDTSTPEGRQQYLAELLGRRAEQMANDPKSSLWSRLAAWWKELVGKIGLWFSKRFGVRLSENGVEALIRAGMRSMRGKEFTVRATETPNGMDISFSLEPRRSVEAAKEKAASTPLMEPSDRDWVHVTGWSENYASVGGLERSFAGLPKEVQAQLPFISGRLDAMQFDRSNVGATTLPDGTLNEVANDLATTPFEKSAIIWPATVNIIDLNSAVTQMGADVAREAKDIVPLIRPEADRTSREKLLEAADGLITQARERLLELRGAARPKGDIVTEARANGFIAFLKNLDEATANVVQSVVDATPDSVLRDPATTPQTIVDGFRTANPPVAAGAEVVNAVLDMMKRSPDLISRLRAVKFPEDSAKVIAAKELLAARQQALAYARNHVGGQNFRTNYAQAVELTDAMQKIVKVDDKGQLVWSNPTDQNEMFTYQHGFTSDIYQKNTEGLLRAARWMDDYAQSEGADPLLRAAAANQANLIYTVHIDQQNDPKAGKLTIRSGFLNPFQGLIRMFGDRIHIPEHGLDMATGHEAKMAGMALQNVANARTLVIDAHEQNRIQASKATAQAAKAQQLPPKVWQQKVANEILSRGQYVGDVPLKVGQMVRGKTITKLDMDAVLEQRAYINALSAAARMIEKTETGRATPIRTGDVVGNIPLTRLAQAPTALTVPQRLDPIAFTFVREWGNLTGTGKALQDAKSELLDRPEYFEPAVIGHVESFTNPAYAADIKSPFKPYYIDLHREHDNTGDNPFGSLDELVSRIVVAQRDLEPKEQMSPTEIRKQVLDEIDHAVNLFTEDERNRVKLYDPDAIQLDTQQAENFMNRPRGKRLLPRGFYTYTAGLDEEQHSLEFAILQVFAQRYLNALASLQNALRAEVGTLTKLIDTDQSKTAADIRLEQKNGERLLNFAEAKELQTVIGREIIKFGAFVKNFPTEDKKVKRVVSGFSSTLANVLLQQPATIVGNFFGPIYERSVLEQQVLQSGQNIFMQMPFVRETVSSTINTAQHFHAAMNSLAGIMADNAGWTEAAQVLRKNTGTFSFFHKLFGDYFARQQRDVARLQRLGVVDTGTMLRNLRALKEFGTSGARLTGKTRTGTDKLFDLSGGLLRLFNELPVGVLPRALGAPLVDAVNNMYALRVVTGMVDKIAGFGLRALEARKVLGMDPLTTVLTPQEVYGNKGANATDLAHLRLLFKKAGINLDRALIQFWQAQFSTEEKDGTTISKRVKSDAPFLTENQIDGLIVQVAQAINKGSHANRPMSSDATMRSMGLFYGYTLAQDARFAKRFAQATNDLRPLLQRSSAATFQLLGMFFMAALLGALGIVPLASYLNRLLFHREPTVKPILEAKSLVELGKISVNDGAQLTPLLGKLALTSMGSAVPGTKLANTALTFVPISFATSVFQTLSKAQQTGSLMPFMDFVKKWDPNLGIILNRLPEFEGKTAETAMRNTLIAHAPEGVDVVAGARGANTIYSAASSQIDTVVNELSRGGSMDVVRQARAAGIQRLVDAGKSQSDATEAFDRSVLARDPYRQVFGRDLTAVEKAKLESELSPDQLANVRQIEQGRQQYAAAFGMTEPDFIKEPTGGGVTAPTIGLRGVRRSPGGGALAPGGVGGAVGGSFERSPTAGLSSGGGSSGGGGGIRTASLGGTSNRGVRRAGSHGGGRAASSIRTRAPRLAGLSRSRSGFRGVRRRAA